MGSTWDQAVSAASSRLSPSDFEDFVRFLLPINEEGLTLVLEAPNRLAATVVESRCQAVLEETLAAASRGRLQRILVRVRSLTQPDLFSQNTASPPPEPRRASLHHPLLPTYTFENFVVGSSNQFAHAAARAVASQPGTHYNPLFLYGGVGLGKTHLANAIGHEILAHNPRAGILYLSSESFMTELIGALRHDRMEEFKERFRHIDVLIVDDVQFLAGRERTQVEFFHTFNSLYEGHRQIVLAADKFPKQIPDLEERLRNRFEWGLIADIQPPDVETRVAIVEKKAEMEKIPLPHDVALFIAAQIDSNVRELEGSLTRLGAFASLNKCAITVDFAREVLRSVLHDRKENGMTIEVIQKAVGDFFNVSLRDLRSKRRSRSVTVPRQVAMYFCRRFTDASYPTIGDRFGGRDHSTAIHANQVIQKRISSDTEFQETIARLERVLEQNGT